MTTSEPMRSCCDCERTRRTVIDTVLPLFGFAQSSGTFITARANDSLRLVTPLSALLTCLLMSVNVRSLAKAPGLAMAAPLGAGPLGVTDVADVTLLVEPDDDGAPGAPPCFLPLSQAATSSALAARPAVIASVRRRPVAENIRHLIPSVVRWCRPNRPRARGRAVGAPPAEMRAPLADHRLLACE